GGAAAQPRTAVGGREALVVAGAPQDHEGEPNNTAAPRTAVGFSRDGRTLRLVAVDGRQRDSGGLTLTGLGRLMRDLGSQEALNLDGGGSTTLLAGRAGGTSLDLENSPSDGTPRKVANGLVLTVPNGSGRATGFRVEALGGATRVFPGLTRTLTATGYDTLLGPAPGPAPGGPRWSAEPGGTGRVDPAGVFRALRPGSALVRVRDGAADGALRLDVLGPLTRIEPTARVIGLADPAETAGFALTGYDAQGEAAPVEGRDVRWEYDRTLWRVGDDGRGGFTLTALVPRATGRLRATLTAPGQAATATELAVGVGLVERDLAALTDADHWTGPGASAAPGPAGTRLRLDPAAAPEPGGADASAAPPRPVPLPDAVRSLALWVDGGGSGSRVAARLRQGDGSELVLRGAAADWTGRRRITLPVPASAERPLTLDRLSAGAGPRPGALMLDTLTATGPPTGEAPPRPVLRDPALVATAAGLGARPLRFALLPGGQPEAGLRRAREEIRAERPDLVLTSGAGPSSAVHRGVRFLRLDGGRRTLDGGGLERLRALRAGIAAARREAGTGALVVVQEERSGQAQPVVDRKEAQLRNRLLAEFRRATGKGAAVITLGGPGPGVSRAEGVLSLTSGPSGWLLAGADGGPDGADRGWLAVRDPAGAESAPVRDPAAPGVTARRG
ncbi:phosphodiester glycosidase family protein, partial [Streptomyces sp. G-G2]|uniref:phosphodiester glycosidase family protein n=1 Tax=Streptomyces sp. G-G2 TaxID=3046201 RepID=UPI0024BB4A3D